MASVSNSPTYPMLTEGASGFNQADSPMEVSTDRPWSSIPTSPGFCLPAEVKPLWKAIRSCVEGTLSNPEKLAGKMAVSALYLRSLNSSAHALTSRKLQIGGTFLETFSFVNRTTSTLNCCLWSGQEHPARTTVGFLGKGMFSTAQAIRNFITEEVFAVKVANNNTKSINELQNEYRQQGLIAQINEPLLVKAFPVAFGAYKNEDTGVEAFCSITKKYSGTCSLLFAEEMTPEKRNLRLKQLYHLLITLERLRYSGTYICDIKADNIFIDGDTLVFGDLGSANSLTTWDISSPSNAIGTFAWGHTTEKDIEGLKKACANDLRLFFELFTKKDVFAFAILMCQLFAKGKKPFETDHNEKYIDASIFNDDLYKYFGKILGPHLTELVLDMLNREPANRPNFKEAIERFSEALTDIENSPGCYDFVESAEFMTTCSTASCSKSPTFLYEYH